MERKSGMKERPTDPSERQTPGGGVRIPPRLFSGPLMAMQGFIAGFIAAEVACRIFVGG
jgi:hypothetical protein